MKLCFVPLGSLDGVHLLSSSFNNTVGHVFERFVACAFEAVAQKMDLLAIFVSKKL